MSAALLAGVGVALGALCWPPRAPRSRAGASGEATRLSSTDQGGWATTRDVAEAMDLLALALESGASVPSCLDRVALECGGQVAAHLRQVAAALEWGVDPRTAWDDVPDAWGPAGTALALAETAGTPPADHLRAAARRVRETEQHRIELAGARVAVGLVLPLGLCFLPAFVLLTVVPVVVALAAGLLR